MSTCWNTVSAPSGSAGCDRLRDEAAAYAERLNAAGSLVAYVEVPAVDHGYNIMSDATGVTRDMYELVAQKVRSSVSS